MKTFLTTLLLFSVFLSFSQEAEIIKDKYTIEGNTVFFRNAETELINGKRIKITNFKFKEPRESDWINHNKWMDAYRNYHASKVAFPRINYFLRNEKIKNQDAERYKFIIYGYYANIQYEFSNENGEQTFYSTPIEWH